MIFCKKCNCELTKNNTDSKDSRYCITCATLQRDYLNGRHNLLNILYNLPLDLKIQRSKRLIFDAVNQFGINHVYILLWWKGLNCFIPFS